jgi:hypothetical protein
VFPVTFAKVSYPTRSGTRRPYVALHNTSSDPSYAARGSNTYHTFNMTWDDNYNQTVYQELTYYLNATLDGFLASWAHQGLPNFYTGPYSSASTTTQSRLQVPAASNC